MCIRDRYIGYGFTLIAHFQRLAVISFTVTNLARYQHICLLYTSKVGL